MPKTVIALGLVVACVLGWAFGVVTSPRINTAAARSSARALALESQAHYQAQLAAHLRDRDATLQATLQQAKDGIQRQLEAYSAEIFSCREQLSAHGITPRVVALK